MGTSVHILDTQIPRPLFEDILPQILKEPLRHAPVPKHRDVQVGQLITVNIAECQAVCSLPRIAQSRQRDIRERQHRFRAPVYTPVFIPPIL